MNALARTPARSVDTVEQDWTTAMERAVPILPGDDLAVAKRYYVEGLGFRVVFEATEDGRNGLLGLERGALCLTIDCPMSGHGRDACVSLQVESADALYDDWRQRVAIKRPPRNESWGARTFDLIDPFGNTIFVMGPVTEEPAVVRLAPGP